MNHYMRGNVQINLDYGTWFWDDGKVVYGTGGNDNLIVAGPEQTLYAGAGNDLVTLHADSKNDVIYGDAGDDFIGTT